jgi:UDP-2,3-diacylglucosamine hydrolase
MTHGAHKPLIFISDLHLQDSRPELTDALVRFLAEQRGACEALYILGDLFEVWLGDDDTGRCGDRVSEALRDFTRSGSRLFLMHGNRDFLMGERFAAQSGAELIQEPYRLKTAHGDILLLHGDSLCTDDLEYQHFRKLVRSAQWQSEFLAKSLQERAQFAKQARTKSREAMATKTEEILDVNQQSVLEFFQLHGCPRLLHGHTHRPAVHSIPLEQPIEGKSEATRMVLGDWGKLGWYALVSDDEWELRQFSIPS